MKPVIKLLISSGPGFHVATEIDFACAQFTSIIF